MTHAPQKVQTNPRAAMTKTFKALFVVAILTATLAISPAQACACGPPDWSMLSDKEIVSIVNRIEDEPRILAGQRNELPPAPTGYRYDNNYRLIPISGVDLGSATGPRPTIAPAL